LKKAPHTPKKLLKRVKACLKIKICKKFIVESFARAFSKARRFKGQRPLSLSAESEIPKTSKKFLFLVLFLLAKGEKEYLYFCFSPFYTT